MLIFIFVLRPEQQRQARKYFKRPPSTRCAKHVKKHPRSLLVLINEQKCDICLAKKR